MTRRAGSSRHPQLRGLDDVRLLRRRRLRSELRPQRGAHTMLSFLRTRCGVGVLLKLLKARTDERLHEREVSNRIAERK
ncbi:MAG: hypothetical protein ACHREM_15950 [Polyangiales bacterium]